MTNPKRETHWHVWFKKKRNVETQQAMRLRSRFNASGPVPPSFIPTSSGSRLDFTLPAVRLAKYVQMCAAGAPLQRSEIGQQPRLGAKSWGRLCLKSMIRSSMLLVMPLPDNRVPVAAAERLATTLPFSIDFSR
jgi:hypothetical protein